LRRTACGACGDEQDAREHAQQAERAEPGQHARRGWRFSRAGAAPAAGGFACGSRETRQGSGRLHALIVTSRRSARLSCAEYPIGDALFAGGFCL
jgi:hypothetical protein